MGYGISHPELVDYVNRVRQPFNVNLLGQAGATAALDDTEYLQHIIDVTESGLALISNELIAMGLTPIPTYRILCCSTVIVSRNHCMSHCSVRVIVRPMHAYGLPNHLRVNVGTDAENERFLTTLNGCCRTRDRR